jgi:hypothetical protein
MIEMQDRGQIAGDDHLSPDLRVHIWTVEKSTFQSAYSASEKGLVLEIYLLTKEEVKKSKQHRRSSRAHLGILLWTL